MWYDVQLKAKSNGPFQFENILREAMPPPPSPPSGYAPERNSWQ